MRFVCLFVCEVEGGLTRYINDLRVVAWGVGCGGDELFKVASQSLNQLIQPRAQTGSLVPGGEFSSKKQLLKKELSHGTWQTFRDEGI